MGAPGSAGKLAVRADEAQSGGASLYRPHGFAAEIEKQSRRHPIVIAEGFQLVHSPRVTKLLTGPIYYLALGKQDARARRTQPRSRTLNPNPLSGKDFDELLWPAHERYLKASIEPLGERVMRVAAPGSEAEVDALVLEVLARSVARGR